MKRKIYVEGMSLPYCDMWQTLGWDVTSNLLEADALCLIGGDDVTPELYAEENTNSDSSINQDVGTFGLITIAERLEIPVVGICRGGQALNVYHGGKMMQHINGHRGSHALTYDGLIYLVTSTHHQGIIPAESAVEVVYGGNYDGREGILPPAEIAVYEPENASLPHICFQPHPEYGGKHDTLALFDLLISQHWGGDDVEDTKGEISEEVFAYSGNAGLNGLYPSPTG